MDRSGGLDLAFPRLSAFVDCFWALLLFVDGHNWESLTPKEKKKEKRKKKEKVLACILRAVELSGTFGWLWRIAAVCFVVRPRFTRTGTTCCRVAQRRGMLCGHVGVTTDPSSDYLLINFATLSIWSVPNLWFFFCFVFVILRKLCNELYGRAHNHIWVFHRAVWVGVGTIKSTWWSCRVIHHNLTVVFVMFHMDSSQRSPL